jgi:2-amino-4-ketopentanoate thiolase alpha subunit
MTDAKRGDFIQVHKVILEPDQRMEGLPPSTKSVPYECWIKGFLIDEKANKGDKVRIETFIGREISGTMDLVNPVYEHNFGVPQREILPIGNEVKKQLKEK